MTRFICLLATAASVILAATVATAAGGTRPNDRATYGLGVVGTAETTTHSRPDDRAGPRPDAVAPDSSSDVVRPDGRAVSRPAAVAPVGSNEAVRPDDRAWRGPEPAPTVAVVQSPSVRVDGFDWADAGIGAAAALGLGLLLVGTSALVRRRQRVAAFP